MQEEYGLVTRTGVGIDNHSDGITCGREAARAAFSSLHGGYPSLALLFTSHPHPDKVFAGVNQVLGEVPLIGATSAGEYTHEGYVEQGAGVMLISSEQIQFHATSYRRRWFSSKKLLGNLHGLSKEGLGSIFKHRTLMLFPDNQSMNLDGLVDQAMTETGMMYDIVGGAGPAKQVPHVFHNRQMYQSGLSGVEILSQKPLGLSLANGWTPLSGPYRVTKVEERRISKIDGRPAREVYEDFLSSNQIQFSDETLMKLLMRYPIGICEQGECKVSMPMGFDGDGAIMMTSPPPTGRLVHILNTKDDAMVTAAQRAIQQAMAGFAPQTQAGALFIDCMSTGMILQEAYHQQRTAVEQSLGDIPFLGFRSHGVIARLRGQIAGHYECSVAACMLPV